jgi:two-component system chemotaxis response regulator CheY
MPEMNGISTLKAIRAKDPEARVLMVSAMGQQHMIVEALESGAMDFLVKPFQPAKVLETVKKCLATDAR